MVAGDAERLEAGALEPVEEGAGLAILLDPRPLGEVAADDDEVGPVLGQPRLRAGDHSRVVGAEMDVGEMGDPGHAGKNRAAAASSLSGSSRREKAYFHTRSNRAPGR